MAAFTVYADGFYRYPDNEDFLKNTLISFYKSVQNNWQKKDWPQTAQPVGVFRTTATTDRHECRERSPAHLIKIIFFTT
jgi:hypothetical protein